MAATYRSYASNAVRAAGTTGITINKPSGVADGDTLVAFIVWSDEVGTWANSQGFSVSSGTGTNPTASSTGNDGNAVVMHKYISNAAGEGSTYTFTNGDSSTFNIVGFIVCVQSTDSTDPIVDITTNRSSNDFTPAAPNIDTTGVDGCCLLTFHAAQLGSASGKTGGAPTSPAFTLIQYRESATTSFYQGAEAAYYNQTTGGNTTLNSWTGTPDDSASEFHVATVAVRPPPPLLNEEYTGSGTATASGSATLSKIKAFVAAGAIALSGIATTGLSSTFTYAASGGATSGGAATTTKISEHSYSAAGGATTGGSAPWLHIKDYVGSGSATSGGAAVVSKTKAFEASGTATTGGAATTSITVGGTTYEYTGVGGAAAGGAATLSRDKAYEPAGGASTSGAATVSVLHIYQYTGSGTATSGGAATTLHLVVYSYSASGGATAGGSATTSLVTLGVYDYTGSGSATTGGAATTSHLVVYTYAASGGAATGGEAEAVRPNRTYTFTPTGTITIGGAATTQLVVFGQAAPYSWLPQVPRRRYYRTSFVWNGSGGFSVQGFALCRLDATLGKLNADDEALLLLL